MLFRTLKRLECPLRSLQNIRPKKQVLTVPGSAFGSGGENHVRLSYVASYQKLEEALNRMEKAVRKLL